MILLEKINNSISADFKCFLLTQTSNFNFGRKKNWKQILYNILFRFCSSQVNFLRAYSRMYRQMKLLEINIYCPKTICDRRCGKFHTKSVKTIVNGLKGILIHNGDLHSNQKSSSRRQSIRSRRSKYFYSVRY